MPRIMRFLIIGYSLLYYKPMASAQEPKVKVFLQGDETSVKPIRLGDTYVLSIDDVAKPMGQSIKVSEDRIEIGSTSTQNADQSVASSSGHLPAPSKWNPTLTKNMNAASIRAMSAIEKYRDVMSPLSHSEQEIKRYQVEAEKSLDEVRISAESAADKAIEQMMQLYLHQIVMTSSGMTLLILQSKRNEISPSILNFSKMRRSARERFKE
jgi:predicted DNA-binding protein (UPF0251 family)